MGRPAKCWHWALDWDAGPIRTLRVFTSSSASCSSVSSSFHDRDVGAFANRRQLPALSAHCRDKRIMPP
eukprot:6481520-Amphidinium_carterae.1